VPVTWINQIKNQVWDRVSVWIFHSSFEKQIIETNNEINVAIVNFQSLFDGGLLDLAQLKKSSSKVA